MTMQWSVNNTPATCAVAVYTLKTLLKAAGWTVPKSSDGTNYNASGDEITSGGSGLHGMDNNKAWFVIQMPGCSRSFCLQRQTTTGANTSNKWRIKYSKSAGFVGGTPSNVQVPSAADEEVLLGTGTDGSPGFSDFFQQSTDGTIRFNALANDAAPYDFLTWDWTVTTGVVGHAFGIEAALDTDASDTDPYFIHLMASTSSWNKPVFENTNTGQLNGWLTTFCSALTSTSFAGSCTPAYVNWGAINVNIFSGKDELLPLIIYRNAVSYKGIMSITKGIGTAARVAGDLFTVVSTGDYVCVSPAIALPWPSGTTPTV